MEWRRLRLPADPACPICGEHPTVTQLIDYDAFCGVPARGTETHDSAAGVPEITVKELLRDADKVVGVRAQKKSGEVA